MEISGHGKVDHLAKLLLGGQEVKGSNAQQTSSRNEAGKDEVHVSGRAKELQRIHALGKEPDQARSERIDRIQQAIESGTYDVSGRKVGDAILKQVLTDAAL